MATERDNTNTGALFTNDKKTNEQGPDLQGKITVKSPGGEVFDMWVSGWMKLSQKGEDYISLALSEPREKSSGKSLADLKLAAKEKAATESKSIKEDLDSDEIPF